MLKTFKWRIVYSISSCKFCLISTFNHATPVLLEWFQLTVASMTIWLFHRSCFWRLTIDTQNLKIRQNYRYFGGNLKIIINLDEISMRLITPDFYLEDTSIANNGWGGFLNIKKKRFLPSTFFDNQTTAILPTVPMIISSEAKSFSPGSGGTSSCR